MLREVAKLGGRLLFWASAAAWLTWPLAAHLATHLPYTPWASGADARYAAWVLSWDIHALSEGIPLLDANIFHPAPHALLYGPPALGSLPLFAPPFLATGNPALALNVLFLGAIALGAAMVHTVVARWTALESAGLVAGATFLFSRWLVWDFVPTAPQLGVVFYLPMIVALAARPRLDGWRWLALFVLVVLQGLADVVYLASAALLPLGIVAALRLARPATRAQGGRLFTVVALAGAVLVAVHAPYVALAWRDPDLSVRTPWRSAVARAKETPVVLPAGLFGPQKPTALPTAVLGLVAIGSLLFVVRRRKSREATDARPWGHAALWAGVGTIMALPAIARIGGEAVPLPISPHAWVPSAIRLPERLAVIALVGFALLCGLAFAEITRRAAGSTRSLGPQLLRGGLALALAVVFHLQFARGIGQPAAYGDPMPAAYPLTTAIRPDSEALRALRGVPGPTVEVPIWVGPLPTLMVGFHSIAMYRSIFHWQPLLNGYASYWPKEFPELMALVAQLPDERALEELRRRTGLRSVLVRLQPHPQVRMDVTLSRAAWVDIATRRHRPDLELVAADDAFLVFRLTDPPAP